MLRLPKEEEVYDREEVLGRDASSVFPRAAAEQAATGRAAVVEALGGSRRFISETELAEIKASRGLTADDGSVAADKPLAAILAERKAQKDAAFQEQWRQMKTGGCEARVCVVRCALIPLSLLTSFFSLSLPLSLSLSLSRSLSLSHPHSRTLTFTHTHTHTHSCAGKNRPLEADEADFLTGLRRLEREREEAERQKERSELEAFREAVRSAAAATGGGDGTAGGDAGGAGAAEEQQQAEQQQQEKTARQSSGPAAVLAAAKKPAAPTLKPAIRVIAKPKRPAAGGGGGSGDAGKRQRTQRDDGNASGGGGGDGSDRGGGSDGGGGGLAGLLGGYGSSDSD